MSDAEKLIDDIKRCFGESADIVIADIFEMADGDIDSWLYGLEGMPISVNDMSDWLCY